MTNYGLSEGSKDLIQGVFSEMMENCSGITTLMVSTVDGHALTSYHNEIVGESRMAAMTSSLLAIAESLAAEAGQNVCKHIIVQNSDGVIVTQRIGKSLVLTAIAGHGTNLGMLHSVTRAGVEKIIKRHK